MNEKVQACLMLSSYLETIGFRNGRWEFNYTINIKTLETYINVWNILIHEYLVLGSNNINISTWSASDDTLLVMAISKAIINGGGRDNYIKYLIEYYGLLSDTKRISGINTLKSIRLLQQKKQIPIDSNMGGNGAAIRCAPIGLKWYNNIEKVIEESIISSQLTHNYFYGFLSGMVVALFTAYAIQSISPIEWCNKLIELYNKKIIHKYYPKEHDINDLDIFMNYWKKYNEVRVANIRHKNTLENCIYPTDRTKFLITFDPRYSENNKVWENIAKSGLNCCIYALDCLFMSMQTPNSIKLDFDNIQYNWNSFVILVAIHPGDNDSTGCIGGAWYGALNGFKNIDISKMKELEFYSELNDFSKQLL